MRRLLEASDPLSREGSGGRGAGAGEGHRQTSFASIRPASRASGWRSAPTGCATTRPSISPTASSRCIATRAAPRAARRAFVTVTDRPVTTAMTKLAQNAALLRAEGALGREIQEAAFQPPVVKAVEVLIETGDFHVTTIGDNLPNENEIREKYGSKNFLLLGSSHALSGASANSMNGEFIGSAAERAAGEQVRRRGARTSWSRCTKSSATDPAS